MTLFCSEGSETSEIDSVSLKILLESFFSSLAERQKILILPPDFTRYNSRAGEISQLIYNHYKEKVTDVLPTLGTHTPVTDAQREKMFGDIPADLFRVHDWRNDVVTIGSVPADMVSLASDGHLNQEWPAQINKLIWEGGHDLILSVGQVVPHEVLGMANYNKNVFIGAGGAEAINLSHFIGACYGMERMMGKADNPLRNILNYASREFLSSLPIIYILTVIGRNEAGSLVIRGLFIGDDEECFNRAADLSIKVNFNLLDEPLQKVVTYMDPEEFRTTWVANKAIYRTRMALADNAELIILAPGVHKFGEDDTNDAIIRKYGYRTTAELMRSLKENPELKENLGALSHLIHGSSEGRFKITYCPGFLSQSEVEMVGFEYEDITKMLQIYSVENMKEGFNTLQSTGETFFYISNPALGLWAYKGAFFDGVARQNQSSPEKGNRSVSNPETCNKRLKTG